MQVSTADSLMQCFSGEGTGSEHMWILSVGDQRSSFRNRQAMRMPDINADGFASDSNTTEDDRSQIL